MNYKDWKREIYKIWGIKFIHGIDFEDEFISKDSLFTTRCSKTKNIEMGYPRQLYISSLTQYFFRIMIKNCLRYGVISDKFGLHLDNEILPYYDIHPSQLSLGSKKILGEKIKQKALRNHFNSIIFYNNSPFMSIPYFEILSFSKMNVFFTTKLIK